MALISESEVVKGEDKLLNERIVKENSYQFVHSILDIGEGMLCSGAEVNRVEEMLIKMGAAYGVKETNVFVIPSVITLTVRLYDGFELTQTRRILAQNVTVNLSRFEKLNDISHKCRENKVSLSELKSLIKESNKPVGAVQFCVGCALVALGFSIFFGGTVIDGIVAAVLSLAVCFFQRKVSVVLSNRIIFGFICAFVLGLLAESLCFAFDFFNVDKVLIGNIMLLIPGVAITISIRDIILGDTISGGLKLIESLFSGGGLALGFWASFLLLGS